MADSAIQAPPPQALFHYLPLYRVLICTACRYAIQPSGIPRHLKEIHRIYRHRRRPFVEYAARFDLAAPEDVAETPIVEFPVQHLPVMDGLRCLASGCGHLCVSVKRMQNHWLTTHGKHACRDGSDGADWEPARLQTFFRGNLVYYFTDPAVLGCSVKPPKPPPPTLCSSLTTGPGQLDAMDQELLHHYLNSTYLTLVDRHGTETVWRHTIPQIAAEHPFLMANLLACTALHVAYKYPSRQKPYLLRAHSLQDVAMPLFRDAINNVTEHNCHAIAAFSHLIVIYSLAADRSDEHMLLADASSPEPHFMCSWLYFIRTGCLLVCGHWDRIEHGPIRSLAASWDLTIVGADALSSSLGVEEQLLGLIPNEDAVEEEEDAAAEKDTWFEETREIYRKAATQLGWAYAASHVLEGDKFTTWDALRIWPTVVSNEYLDLLASDHPAALILLGHYCRLLERLQTRWYFEGRANTLLERVMKRLDPKWHPSLRPLRTNTCIYQH